jgi:serine phosphatase RsbU (regulator of sigma subunit)
LTPFFKYCLFALSLCASLKAQVNPDSLRKIWKDPKQADSTRLKALRDLAFDGYLYSDPDSAIYYAQLQHDFAAGKNYKNYQASALNTQGIAYYLKGEMAKAIDHHSRSMKLKQEIGEKAGVSGSLNNIGNVYQDMGDYLKAIDYYTRSLKLDEEAGNKIGMAYSMNSIGNALADQGDNDKALEYYQKSIDIYEKFNDKQGRAMALNNISNIYYQKMEDEKATDLQEKSLQLSREIGDQQGVATALNNLGHFYMRSGNTARALEYLTEGLKVAEASEDKGSQALALSVLAKTLLKMGKTEQAVLYARRALSIAEEIGVVFEKKEASFSLYQSYKKMKKYREALEMHEFFMAMRDTTLNQANQREVVKHEMKYIYEKKAMADSVRTAGEKKIAAAQLKEEQTKRYSLYVGLALVMVFAIFMVNRFRVTNRQKKIIEQKEKETQKQNEIIAQQKHQVEEHRKEIIDSINYAQRIQRALLASGRLLESNLPEHFIFFKPKDIVSGDFYWASVLKNGSFALVTADSTGHGVPGAIMSMLNIACLTEAANGQNLSAPAKILDYTRSRIIEHLSNDGSAEGGKDGMDCSLVSFDFKNKKLSYAAANNPVWLVRSSSPKELEELSPDKMPVGKHDRDATPFTEHEIALEKGDIVYTLTDGMPDQFGGEKGKKFKYKPLKQLLLDSCHLPMKEQKEIIGRTLASWMGNLEQVDDILIIGVRI